MPPKPILCGVPNEQNQGYKNVYPLEKHQRHVQHPFIVIRDIHLLLSNELPIEPGGRAAKIFRFVNETRPGIHGFGASKETSGARRTRRCPTKYDQIGISRRPGSIVWAPKVIVPTASGGPKFPRAPPVGVHIFVL